MHTYIGRIIKLMILCEIALIGRLLFKTNSTFFTGGYFFVYIQILLEWRNRQIFLKAGKHADFPLEELSFTIGTALIILTLAGVMPEMMGVVDFILSLSARNNVTLRRDQIQWCVIVLIGGLLLMLKLYQYELIKDSKVYKKQRNQLKKAKRES